MSGAHRRWSLSVPVRLLLLSLLTLSLAVGLSSCGGKAGKANRGLVGRWESADRSEGAIGNTLELTADNKLYYTIGAMVDGKYTVAGDQLTVALGDSGASADQSRVTGFRVKGDTLTIIPTGEGRQQSLARVGKRAGGSPVAGTWTYRHPAGANAYEAYAPNGAFHFRLPMQTIEGTYTVTADSVELRLAEVPARKAAYKIENGILTLTDSAGRAGTYTAVDAVLPDECSRAAAAPQMMAPPGETPPAAGPPPAEAPAGGQ